MKSTEIGFAGADIIGKRYVLCVIDHEGKHPRYARGRSDTVKGREKFFATIPPETPLMIVESELAVLSLHLLGESRVYIQKETEGYAVWERAGVNRGERMAIFAAKLLYSTSQQIPLTERQQLKLLEIQGRELERIQRITDGSLSIIEKKYKRGGVQPKLMFHRPLKTSIKAGWDSLWLRKRRAKILPPHLQRMTRVFSLDSTDCLKP